MTVDDEIVNSSGNRPFEDVLQARISRRGAIAGGLATTAAGFLATTGVVGAQEAGDAAASTAGGQLGTASAPIIDFTPVAKADAVGPDPTISEDYEMQVIIPWGTPLEEGVPDMGPNRQTSAAIQRRQVGVTPDQEWMFINLQHPGNGDPAETNFPVPGQGGPEIPRDATIAIRKKGGGTVGS